jgi:hypothetical protein
MLELVQRERILHAFLFMSFQRAITFNYSEATKNNTRVLWWMLLTSSSTLALKPRSNVWNEEVCLARLLDSFFQNKFSFIIGFVTHELAMMEWRWFLKSGWENIDEIGGHNVGGISIMVNVGLGFEVWFPKASETLSWIETTTNSWHFIFECFGLNPWRKHLQLNFELEQYYHMDTPVV